MKLSAIRQEASVVMTTDGLVEAKNEFDALSKAQKDAAQSSELFARQTDIQEKSITRVASKLTILTNANDAVSASGSRLARMEALLAAARKDGLPITDANIRALETLKIKHEAANEATRKSTGHINDNIQAMRKQASVLDAINASVGIRDFRTGERAADIAAYGAELDRVRAKISPLFAAERQYLSALDETNHAARVGAINERERADSIARTTAAFSSQIAKMHEAGIATTGATTAVSGRIISDLNARANQTTINERLGVRADFGGESRGADIAAYGVELSRLQAKYDPLFAVQQRYRADLAGLSDALRKGAISEKVYADGLRERKAAFTEQVAGLGLVSRAYREAGLAAERSARQIADAASKRSVESLVGKQTIFPNRAADIAAYGNELDRLRAKFSPLFAAQTEYKAQLDGIREAARLGALTENERAAAIGRTKEAFAAQVTGLRGVTSVTEDHRRAMRQQRFEFINLSRQFQDIGVSLAGGQDLGLVAIQQGSQIFDVFQSSGRGATTVLKEFGATALRFATNPITIMVAALAAAGVAALDFDERQRALERSLNGVGRAAGVTANELRGIGTQAGVSSGIGERQGVDLASKFAGAGIGGSNIGALVADVQPFARAFGLDMEKAGDEIAQIVSESGLGAFEKRFGAASFAQKEVIRSLEETGRFIDAETEKTRLLNEELAKTKDTSSLISKIWDKIKIIATTPAVGLGDVVNRYNASQTLQGQLAAAQEEFRSLRAKRGPNESPFPNELAAGERVRELKRRQDEEISAVARAKRNAELELASPLAGRAIESLSPDSVNLRKLIETRDSIKPFLESAEALGKLGPQAGNAARAVQTLDFQIANFQNAAQAASQDAALAVREIGARTFAEREAVATQRAWNAAIRSGKIELEASIAVEAERAKLRAESERKIDDLGRSVKDEAELSGLSPLARRLKEIDFQFRDFREQNLPGADSPVATKFEQAGNAAQTLANALLDSASKISGAASLPILARGGSGSDSAGLLRRFEGFIPRAKFDVNAYRAGFGSDTTTRSDGSVERIRRDSVVSQADAERDLQRRLTQFEGKIKRQIGESAFGSLSDNARASLTSVAYNYGSLPSRVLPAARGGDDSAIANAIRSLAGDNGGVNRSRRLAEADNILGGPPRRTANDNTSASGRLDQLQAERRSIAIREETLGPIKASERALQDQTEALRAQERVLGEDEASLRGATEANRLLTSAQRFLSDAHITDAKLMKELEERSRKYGVALTEQLRAEERFQKARRELTEKRDFVREGVSGTLGSVAKAAAHGERVDLALKQSLRDVSDRLIERSVNSLTEDLLGKQGTLENGLLGGLLGSIGIPGFGTGQQQAQQVDVQANVVNVNGGVSGAGVTAGGGLFSGLLSGLASLFGSTGTSVGQGGTILAPFADGGVMTSRGPLPLHRYAGGGVARSPQMALFGEGRGPEAFVPLPDGRSIPVSINAAISAARAPANSNAPPPAPQTQVNIHGAPAGTQVQESTDSRGGRRVDVMLGEAFARGSGTQQGRSAMAEYGMRQSLARR